MPSFEKRHKDLLRDVSRSFYLSFLALPTAVRPTMALGYLLCRAADTIADTPTPTLDEKLGLLRQFKQLFTDFPLSEVKLKDFLQDLDGASLAPKAGEKKLLARFDDCAAWFKSLPRTDQSLLQSVVSAVITGMEMDLRVFGELEEASVKALAHEKDLETYIHWIGGEPGRFWSDVCLAHLPDLKIQNREQWVQDAIVFGTGLQMVNILRDLPSDLKMGRCYIPTELLSRHSISVDDLVAAEKIDLFLTVYNDLIDQTMFRLERGLSYIHQLPKFAFGLRMAVWLPMMIGVKTLNRLRRHGEILKTPAPVKVTRKEIYRLVLTSLPMLPMDALLKRWFASEA